MRVIDYSPDPTTIQYGSEAYWKAPLYLREAVSRAYFERKREALEERLEQSRRNPQGYYDRTVFPKL